MIDRLNAALEGRYRIERELGAGGMATVYLARDVRHDRQVAVKVLKPELAAVMGSERFLTEIRTTARLQHPHILPLFDSGEADGQLFYVMPYIEGESLRERLDREKQLPVDEAVAIAAKVAGALQAAHEQGIVHRDIKPANILLANGEPLVADFGIALAVQHAGGGRLTETGLSLGTPYYMSPEQATGDRDPDQRSDLYALGCVLHEMLAGEPPFTGGTAQAVLGRILTGEPTPLGETRRSVPPHVEATVLRALEKTPADRFASASEMIRSLSDPGAAAGLTGGYGRMAGAGSPRSSGPLGRLAPWLVAAGALGVAGWAVAAGGAGDATGAAPTTRFTLAGTGPGGLRAVNHVAVSDDGSEIVFAAREQGQVQLYRRPLRQPGVQRLPGTEDALFPVFSPDGGTVAFTDGEARVKVMGVAGGSPATILETPDYPIGIAWAPDSSLVFGMLSYNSDWPALTRSSLREPELRGFTDLADRMPADTSGRIPMHHEPVRIPGTDAFLFTDFSAAGRAVRLGRASLSEEGYTLLELGGTGLEPELIVGITDDVLLFTDPDDALWAVRWNEDEQRPEGTPVPVPDAPEGIASARLSPSGTLVMVVRPDEYDVVLLDRSGRVLNVVVEGPVDDVLPRFSPDGRWLALSGGPIQGRDDLWLYDLDAGVFTQLGFQGAPSALAWSPGSERIWGSLSWPQDQRTILRSRAADASDQVQTEFELGDDQWVWSVDLDPTGTAAALTLNSGNWSSPRLDLMTLRLDGGETAAPEPFAAGPYQEFGGTFSPDGRWIAYVSNESGRYQVYARPWPGPGGRVQISAEVGGQPVWSGDGSRIFYRTDEGLVEALLETSPDRLAVRERRILFTGDFAGSVYDDTGYHVHPDGTRFAMVRNRSTESGKVVVWQNWLHELRPLLE